MNACLKLPKIDLLEFSANRGDSKTTATDCIANVEIHSMSCENIIKTSNLEGCKKV